MNEWQKEMIAGFQEKNPNVKINLIIVPEDQVDQKAQTMIAGGDVPDVFVTNWGFSGFSTYKDQLLDLAPYIKKDPDSVKGIGDDIMNVYRSGDKTYGIPIVALGSYLFYNKDLFDQAGISYPPTDWNDKSWTWDKMVEVAKKLTKNMDNAQKRVFGVYDELFPQTADAWLFGGDYFKPEAYKTNMMGEPTVSDEGVRRGIQAHLDLIQKYKVHPSTADLNSISAIGVPFLTGQVAMHMKHGGGFWVNKPAKFRWGVAALPYTVENRRTTMFIDSVNILKATKHPDEAWAFVRHITDPNGGAKRFMEVTNATPANGELLKQWYEMMAKNLDMTPAQIKQVHEGSLAIANESPNHLIKNFNAINNAILQPLNSVYDGKKDIDTALKEIKSGLNALK
ncbi:hypothetical protein SD70_01035 [Gordoniibacillus kamchatkensis]|uniref:Sugar ABC transporter substrate-binding protein n=2 Tax=Gordoniibacillus kamchatkensis TaxID=1590651 RepID=A0ABR5ANN2_9BACL|nr:hypothetical protein SD70_01035 [Paenibacillus sp. VKM B-2647]